MTTALANPDPKHLSAFTAEQRALIKRTVAADATDDELAMFLHVARNAGLDPLQREVWFVKRRYKDKNQNWQSRVTIQAGVDGLQARALEMGDCEGIQSAAVYEKDDFIFNMRTGEVVKHEGNPFANRGALIGAWGIVTRKGKLPFYALVRFSEYNDSNSPLWMGKPTVMIEKVARSTALRRAYPKNFGGIYDPAEMGDAAKEPEEGVLDHPKTLPSHRLETEAHEDAHTAAEGVEAAMQSKPEEPPPAETHEDAKVGIKAVVGDVKRRKQEVLVKAERLLPKNRPVRAWLASVLGRTFPDAGDVLFRNMSELEAVERAVVELQAQVTP